MKKSVALFLAGIAVLLIWRCGEPPATTYPDAGTNPNDGCPANANYIHEQDIIEFAWYEVFQMNQCEPFIRLVSPDDTTYVVAVVFPDWPNYTFHCLKAAYEGNGVCTDGLYFSGGEIQILVYNNYSLCTVLVHELYHAKLYIEAGDADGTHSNEGWKTIVPPLQMESCKQWKG